ncbi:MAG: hypothetical protein RLZZ536_1929, partial [Planctomycetota bacterium]
GETVRISEIAAEITEITARHVRLKDQAGIWKLVLGGALRERVLEAPAEPVTPVTETPQAAVAPAETSGAPEPPAPAPGVVPESPTPAEPPAAPEPTAPAPAAPAEPAAPANPAAA